MLDDFNKEDFLNDLNNIIAQEEMKDLNISFNEEMDSLNLISNKSQADYFCKLVANLKQQKEEENKFIDEEINRVTNHYEEFRKKENNKIDNKISFLENALKQFAIEELKDSNKKSIKLPYGTLSFKKQQDKFEYDEESILKWLKENNNKNFIKIKSTEIIDKKELKKQGYVSCGTLYINDKPVDGITVTPQQDKFEIK